MSMLSSPRLVDVLRAGGIAAAGTAAAAVVLAVAYFIPTRPEISLLLAAGVCLFGLTLMDSAIIPLLMVVPALATFRVAAGGTDLSLSDAALTCAFFPALIFSQRPFTPALRALVWIGVFYQAMTVFTLIVNPYVANYVEWVHAGLLVIGTLVVGWSIGREGHARLALMLILVAITVLGGSVIAEGIFQYARGDFSPLYPSWPYPMHKNAAGCLFGFAAALAYARPSWLRWHPAFAYACFWVCVVGLGICQSRQAMAGLAVALIVIVMRTHDKGKERRSKVILFAVLGAIGFMLVMVRNQIASGNEHNSFFQRVDWFNESLRIWQTDPLFGVGLRWWYTDRFEIKFQPPNGTLEALTTTGIVGLVGFLVLMIGTVVVLWRVDLKYGLVPLAVVLSRFVQGQLDLFWVAVQTSVPFLIVGIFLGAQGRELAEEAEGWAASQPVEDRGGRPLETTSA
jgi:polysaccharide biosynthesis protein PslJ